MSLPPVDDSRKESANVVQVDFSRVSTKKPDLPAKADTDNQQKLSIFVELLGQGVVSVVLNAQVEGVKLPPQFAHVFNLRLNFSRHYGLKDFAYTEEGVSATLSFDEGFCFCAVPWESVYLIEAEDGKSGAVWSDYAPQLAEKQNEPNVAEGKSKEDQKNPEKKASFLRLVTDKVDE